MAQGDSYQFCPVPGCDMTEITSADCRKSCLAINKAILRLTWEISLNSTAYYGRNTMYGTGKYGLSRVLTSPKEDWDTDNESNYMQTSIDSDAEASEQENWDVDNKSNYPQTSDNSDAEAYSEEDDNNSGTTDCSFHRTPRNSNSVNHDNHALTACVSTIRQGECEMSTLHDETPTVSGTFTFLMNAQLALILFLGLSRLYEQM
ncbi:hypothetical protein DFH08DRAFT_815398 [Mycena albidolilacea]|uniref:Uncharacterized protein n=1 Tax=Mycena albidolilacea TaxID=1033008 RepID=A0AAD7EJY2_9AGAR|nr:hypothetical protein DFH08DRAFT_815398 [Mycena albidolilacea]